MLTLALALACPAIARAADPSWIVVLDPSADPGVEARLAHANGAAIGHVYRDTLVGFSFEGSASAAAALRNNPRVRAVVPNREVSLVDVAAWGFFRIEADVAHSGLTGGWTGEGVRVLILDTGADLDHPDLQPNVDLARSLDCLTPGSLLAPEDLHGHGTHVAGIAAAAYNTDGSGIVGVAPDADLVVVRAFDADGYGDTDDILCGLEHARQLAADGVPIVANLSFSDTGTDTACDDADVTDVMHEAICDAVDGGVVFVAAAGNAGVNAANTIPAAFTDEVITVSALADFDGLPGGLAGCSFSLDVGYECDDSFANFSNRGPAVDVVAPGVRVYSSVPGGFGNKSGTSMAAPFVTGTVALMLSADPLLTAPEIEALLRSTGECPNGQANSDGGLCSGAWPDDTDGLTEPLVNARRAVGAADPAPSVVITLSAKGTTSKGKKRVDLTWNVTGGDTAEVLRDGALREITADDGAWSDTSFAKKARFWSYQVCADEVCSNVVTIKI